MKKELLIILAFLVVIFFFTNFPIMWDELIYNLNARYFLGRIDFFDNFRPPVYSIILSVFYLLNIESLNTVLPKIFLILLLLATYFFAKSFTKKPVNSLIVLLSFPVITQWANSFMTEIPSAFFAICSLIFLKKCAEKYELKNLLLTFFFATLATLTRYPMGLIYPVVVALYLIYVKKKNWLHFIIGNLIYLAPIILWVNFISLEIFISAFKAAASDASSPAFFLANFFIIFGLSGLFLIKLFRYKFKKEDYWLIVPILSFLIFFQSFSHKEARFLISILPFIAILIAKLNIKQGFLLAFSIITFAISAYFIIYLSSAYSNIFNNAFSQVAGFFKDKSDEVILTNMVPYCFYFTKNPCFMVAWEPEWFVSRINELNASYLLISDNKISHPYYSNNQSFYGNYSLEKKINIGFENIFIYKAKEVI